MQQDSFSQHSSIQSTSAVGVEIILRPKIQPRINPVALFSSNRIAEEMNAGPDVLDTINPGDNMVEEDAKDTFLEYSGLTYILSPALNQVRTRIRRSGQMLGTDGNGGRHIENAHPFA